MNKKSVLIRRIVAVLLMALGILLGVTWSRESFCLGDTIFLAMGLPAWSKGTSGTHYPAVVGSFAILIGIGILNTTLQKKARLWVWTSVVLVLIVLSLAFSI